MNSPHDRRHPIGQWFIKVNRASAILSGVALLMMMVAGAADVIGTNLDLVGLQSRPVPAAFEFMATMMVVTVFLATALAQSRRAHIRVEVIVNLLPDAGQKAINCLRHALSIAMWALIAWYGWHAGVHSVSVGEYAPGLINFPVWPARLVLGFGATMMAVQCIFDLLGVFVPSLRVVDETGAGSAPIS